MSVTQFILASASPRRKDLLGRLKIPFEVIPSEVAEDINEKNPALMAGKLSADKARTVAEGRPTVLVLGADTVVAQNNTIFGKPVNHHEVLRMLNQLSNTTHHVITAVTLVKTDKEGNTEDEWAFQEQTEVTFHTLDDINLKNYARTDIPYDKAGGYGIQNVWGSIFVKSIDGDFFNVMGLPLQRVARALKLFAPVYMNKYLNMFTE